MQKGILQQSNHITSHRIWVDSHPIERFNRDATLWEPEAATNNQLVSVKSKVR